VSKRARFFTYGSGIALVLAGTVCAAFVAGVRGQVLAMALIGSGLVILTGLVFMEVGLSEDRDRAKERGRGAEHDRHVEHDRRVERDRLVPSASRSRLDEARPPRLRGSRHER
jgi:hypothetical protein